MSGRRKNTLTTEQQIDMEMRLLGVLQDNEGTWMSIGDIQASDMMLKNLSVQKISRMIAHLVDFNMVQKQKDFASNHMTYKLTQFD